MSADSIEPFRPLRIDVVKRVNVHAWGKPWKYHAGMTGTRRLLSEEEGLALLSEAGRTPATQEHSALLEDRQGRQSRPYRRTNARRSCLCRVYGYKVESKDPRRDHGRRALRVRRAARFETAYRGQRRNYGVRRRSHEADPIP